MALFQKLTPKKIVLFLFFVYACIYFVEAIPNNYFFRNSATDLGGKLQAMYQIMQGNSPRFLMGLDGKDISYFADHFSPIIYLFSPFVLVFGMYTFSFLQVVFILIGGWGIYYYAKNFFQNKWFPVLSLFLFFNLYGIYSALGFEGHFNVLAAMLVPWLFLFYRKDKFIPFVLIFAFIILSKENMSLWLFFIMIGLLAREKFRPKRFIIGKYICLFFSLIYFVLVFMVVMPRLNPGVVLQAQHFEVLGGTGSSIISNLLTHPWDYIKYLWLNTTTNPANDYVKIEFYIYLFVCGGFFFFLRPYYLLMIIPLIAQKAFISNPNVWGLNDHYSIEFMPLLILAAIDFLSSKKFSFSFSRKFFIACIILVVGSMIHSFDNRQFWFRKENVKFYSRSHFRSDLNIPFINEQLKDKIPASASVCASNCLVPALYYHHQLYFIPHENQVDYLVFLDYTDGTWPLTYEENKKMIKDYEANPDWQKVLGKNDLFIFKRVKGR
ncbi:MAG: DUF2079 domain-containing protein [Bacteroidales bacterium]